METQDWLEWWRARFSNFVVSMCLHSRWKLNMAWLDAQHTNKKPIQLQTNLERVKLHFYSIRRINSRIDIVPLKCIANGRYLCMCHFIAIWIPSSKTHQNQLQQVHAHSRFAMQNHFALLSLAFGHSWLVLRFRNANSNRNGNAIAFCLVLRSQNIHSNYIDRTSTEEKLQVLFYHQHAIESAI